MYKKRKILKKFNLPKRLLLEAVREANNLLLSLQLANLVLQQVKRELRRL
jgi:hypothetical protein